MCTTVLSTALAVLFWVSLSGSPATAEDSSVDLSRWKLTLPEDSDRPGNPDEILPPELSTYTDPRFLIREKDSALRFRAPCGGATTRGSAYPRCELREFTEDGQSPASWGAADGKTHRLQATFAVTHLPAKKPHVICLQIHNEKHKLLAIRVEGTKLLVEGEGQKDHVFQRNYQLETPVMIDVQTGDGRIRVGCDGKSIVDWDCDSSNCYFKAGCYTQSNIKSGDRADDYAEVKFLALRIGHTKP